MAEVVHLHKADADRAWQAFSAVVRCGAAYPELLDNPEWQAVHRFAFRQFERAFEVA